MDGSLDGAIDPIEDVLGRREEVPRTSDIVQPVRRQLRLVRPSRQRVNEIAYRIDVTVDRLRVAEREVDRIHLVGWVTVWDRRRSQNGVGARRQRAQVGSPDVRRGGRNDEAVVGIGKAVSNRVEIRDDGDRIVRTGRCRSDIGIVRKQEHLVNDRRKLVHGPCNGWGATNRIECG